MSLPNHVAIIMDGNGRWAQNKKHSRLFGHIRGARRAKDVIQSSLEVGIKNLTLFTFSTENWLRPSSEVHFLMKLLTKHLVHERDNLLKNNICFRCIGDIHRLDQPVQDLVLDLVDKTKNNTAMNLVFALSYSGRQELTNAIKDIAVKAKKGLINPQNINDSFISNSLESSFLPDPDLIIRTSGEYRLSNFFLWQAAYSELFVCDKYWPDFIHNDLIAAFDFYKSRRRRFGKIQEQIQPQISPL